MMKTVKVGKVLMRIWSRRDVLRFCRSAKQLRQVGASEADVGRLAMRDVLDRHRRLPRPALAS